MPKTVKYSTIHIIFIYAVISFFDRTILAALHFNFNLRRANKTTQDGQTRFRVSYVKYKEGEGTVRNVRVKQDFCKCGRYVSV